MILMRHISGVSRIPREKINDGMRLIRDLKLKDWGIESLSDFLFLYTHREVDAAPRKIRGLTVGNLLKTFCGC